MQKLLSSMLLLAAYGCQPTLIAEFQDRPVVEAYLYTGEMAQVKISKLIPFRPDEVSFSGEDVHRLAITITDQTTETEYPLQPDAASADSAYGLYSSADLLPQAGHTYALQFVYDGQQVSALTQTPAVPANVHFSAKTIAAQQMGGGGMGAAPEPIEISWDNDDGGYYSVAVFAQSTQDTINSFGGAAPSSFQTAPVQTAEAQITQRQFSFYGAHLVRVCRVQAEYVVLYESMQRGAASSVLTEANANVSGGFGLFTAVGVHCDTIKVVR